MDVVLMSLQRWEADYASITKALAKEFSYAHRVFYINHPYTFNDIRKMDPVVYGQEKYNTIRSGKHYIELIDDITVITPPVIWSINWLPKGPWYDWAWKQIQKPVLETLDNVIAKFNIDDFLFLNCYDPFILPNLDKGKYNTKVQIYHCIDDIEVSEYMYKHGPGLEAKACKNADIVTVTSSHLHTLKSRHNPNTHLVPNAVEMANFERTRTEKFERPNAIAHVRTPIIGFVGNLDVNRIDYPLIKKTAEAHTDKHLVLVGPVNSPQVERLGIDKMPNVIMGGAQHINELPKWLQHFDCTIIPFLKNKLTKSIYPLKINEYLAAGKAVVSTHFSNDIAGFSDVIFLCGDHDSFLAACDEAIHSNSEVAIAQRVAISSQNTWKARVARLWELISAFENEKRKAEAPAA